MHAVFLYRRIKRYLDPISPAGLGLLLALIASNAHCAESAEEISVEVLDTELSLLRFTGDSNDLIIWVSPGFGDKYRAYEVAQAVSQRGIEVWHIDLAESLFLTQGTNTLRSLDGRYVAGLVTAAHRQTGRSVDDIEASWAESTALKRLGQPEEFGAAAAFLCSERASFVTGTALVVDGGRVKALL